MAFPLPPGGMIAERAGPDFPHGKPGNEDDKCPMPGGEWYVRQVQLISR